MTDITIRPVEGDERIEISRQLAGYAFRATPPLPDRHDWDKMLQRLEGLHVALFEDDVPVSYAVSTPLSQNVRGAIMQAGALWGVATHPSARRHGHSRQTLAWILAQLAEEGTPLSVLYPFEESFYDRMGYTTFPAARKATFAPETVRKLLSQHLEGGVRLMSIDDGFDAYRAFLYRQQRRTHGMALFGEHTAGLLRDRNDQWVALAEVDGETVGAMLYQLGGQNQPMTVHRFYYENSQGLYLLLEWFARHIGQSSEIEVKLPPGEHPETWLPGMGIRIEAFEPPMARVVNIELLGGMQTGPGSFSARVYDPHCPWNEGCYRFSTAEGWLQVNPCETSECYLTIQGVTALVYGTHDPEGFLVRGWGNPTRDLQATMRSMFPPRLPYLHEVF